MATFVFCQIYGFQGKSLGTDQPFQPWGATEKIPAKQTRRKNSSEADLKKKKFQRRDL